MQERSDSTTENFWKTQQLSDCATLTSFCRFQTPSLCVNSSCIVRHLGRIRHSKPHMLNSRFGLSLLYTDTKLFSHCTVVTERGSRFLMSQNTARPLQVHSSISNREINDGSPLLPQ